MAKMNIEQQEILDEMAEAKAKYDQFEEALTKEIRDRRWEAKAPIRTLVRKARAEEIPFRRIGIALGTSDHNTLRDYETETRKK